MRQRDSRITLQKYAHVMNESEFSRGGEDRTRDLRALSVCAELLLRATSSRATLQSCVFSV
jgi:hypothetical protein